MQAFYYPYLVAHKEPFVPCFQTDYSTWCSAAMQMRLELWGLAETSHLLIVGKPTHDLSGRKNHTGETAWKQRRRYSIQLRRRRSCRQIRRLWKRGAARLNMSWRHRELITRSRGINSLLLRTHIFSISRFASMVERAFCTRAERNKPSFYWQTWQPVPTCTGFQWGVVAWTSCYFTCSLARSCM